MSLPFKMCLLGGRTSEPLLPLVSKISTLILKQYVYHGPSCRFLSAMYLFSLQTAQ